MLRAAIRGKVLPSPVSRSDNMNGISDVQTALWEILQRVRRIEEAVVRQGTAKAAYTTSEFARLVDLDVYTVREHCRIGRINASKRACGRGDSLAWSISHSELERYQNEGLLPEPHKRRTP